MLKEQDKSTWEALKKILESFDSVVTAFSGGVDSALLAYAAHTVFGWSKAVAVLADSPSLPRREMQSAQAFAGEFGIRLLVIQGSEFENAAYLRNAGDRCYHCKADLFSHLRPIALQEGFKTLVYGANTDDASEFRPGSRAALEAGIRAPLAEAGLNKAAVRSLAYALGLPLWDKPAAPCLSSRIPHGTPVTVALLDRVEKAEAFMAGQGFREFRVRVEGNSARLELAREEWPKLQVLGGWLALQPGILAAGFTTALFDSEGLKRGGLSNRLTDAEKQKALGGLT